MINENTFTTSREKGEKSIAASCDAPTLSNIWTVCLSYRFIYILDGKTAGLSYIPAGLLTNLFGAVFARRKYGLSGCARNIPRIPKPKQGVQHVRTASVAIVTGAASNIGLACAQRFAATHTVIMADIAEATQRRRPCPMPSPCGSTSESLIHALIWLRKPGNTDGSMPSCTARASHAPPAPFWICPWKNGRTSSRSI